MPDVKGRPYAFLAIMLVLWASGRTLWSSTGALPEKLSIPAMAKPQAPRLPTRAVAHPVMALPAPEKARALSLPAKRQQRAIIAFDQHSLLPALVPWQDGGWPPGLPVPLRVAGDGKPLSPGRDTPPTIALAPLGEAEPLNGLRQKRWQLYAYSFWRLGADRRQELAPAAQYGGSQIGGIFTFDPFGAAGKGMALMTRGAMTPNGKAREAAFGLRWQPQRGWPVQLTAEYRLRAHTPDNAALYIAGGIDQADLGGGWALNAFGQSGYATGPNGGVFYDAQLRATHALLPGSRRPLRAGGGLWAGGQENIGRVDIGPTFTAPVKLGEVPVLLQLDWRIRIHGNAAPKQGLAVTLSTGL